MSGSASTRMTEAPASRAKIAAGMPAAPDPMTTMSASRCHDAGDGTATAETVPRKSSIMACPSGMEFAKETVRGPPNRSDDREDQVTGVASIYPELSPPLGSVVARGGSMGHTRYGG